MSQSVPWYKNWIFWLALFAFIGYMAREEEPAINKENSNNATLSDDNSSEDSLLIIDMHEFLQAGTWECVEIAKGDGTPMLGATFTFMEDRLIVENFGRRHELPFQIEFVLSDYPDAGVSAAHLNINGNKEMLASFDTDKNLLMLSWSNDSIKMKLIRNN